MLFRSALRLGFPDELHTAAGLANRREAAEELDTVVQGLDDTSGELRRAVFALRTSRSLADAPLRSRLLAVVGDATAGLGAGPQLRLVGRLDSAVAAGLAEDVLAVVREALSNVAKHANARTVEVSVTLEADRLAAVVADDGRGLPANRARRSGLRSLCVRAHNAGGRSTAGTGPGGLGTVLVWTVPLS